MQNLAHFWHKHDDVYKIQNLHNILWHHVVCCSSLVWFRVHVGEQCLLHLALGPMVSVVSVGTEESACRK